MNASKAVPSMKCPTCRGMVSKETVELIIRADGALEAGPPVMGDHSAKIKGIIQRMKQILDSDSHDKIVVR